MFPTCRPIVAALLALVAASGPAGASGPTGNPAASGWATADHAQIRLISSTATHGPGALKLGLHVRLDEGWKTYWRSPGDAGLPPVLDWTGSGNLAGATMHWPAPVRFDQYGVTSFGYRDEVVYPITVKTRTPGQAARLRLAVDYAVCREVCIPLRAELALDLAPSDSGAPGPSVFAALIERYSGRVPGSAQAFGARVESVVASGSGEAQALEVTVLSERPLESPFMVVEGPPEFRFGASETRLLEGGSRVVFRIPCRGSMSGDTLAGRSVTLSLFDGARGFRHTAVASR